MGRNIRNNAASIHQRLLNRAKESSRPFNELLQYFAIERFLYRLSVIPQANRLILKGALMLWVWSGQASRPTKDIDLLGRIDNSFDVIIAVMKDACRADVELDGMFFDAETVTAVRIKEDAEYEGVRIHLKGSLGNARVSLQVDLGFGDVIIPRAHRIKYPTLLDLPSPELNGYSMESVIAEKFEAMVKLDVLNSRMKDFYDIWMLSRMFDFRGEMLTKAISRTFENRKTPIPADLTVFQPSFAENSDKEAQWRGFVKKTRLNNAPFTFGEVVEALKAFLGPPAASLAGRDSFQRVWNAPGPWQ